uniref:ODV-EC43 n=1 Tax=Strongyloides venezuelensis TaxID=75913 RepID=A0A0K0FZC2_STRVS
MATSNVAVPADNLNSKAVASIVNNDSFSNYANITSRQLNENPLDVLVLFKTYPILLYIENNFSPVSTVADVSKFSRKRKHNNFVLSLYVKSLEKNDLTLESCYPFINLLTTEGSNLELKNIPKFVKYESIMGFIDLNEIYKARNVHHSHALKNENCRFDMCYSTLRFLTPLQIYEGFINECTMMKKYGYVNSIINENFFSLQRAQDTLSKKERYFLNRSQTLTVTKAFYEYLIKININDYENGVKIKFKQIINLLKVLLNVTYLCMELDMDINGCSRLCE